MSASLATTRFPAALMRSNVYLAQPGSSKELFYVNDKLVLNPIELKAMDQLSIGDTKLMFVPLCSEKFHW